jgi:hypothetical protein
MMRSLAVAFLGSLAACLLTSSGSMAQTATGQPPAEQPATGQPAAPDASAPADSDKVPVIHLPKDFWGIELRARAPFTGHPDVFGLWKLEDGSLAVGIFWKNAGELKPDAATILNLSSGAPALPDEEAWKAANDDDEMSKLEERYKMTWFKPSQAGIELAGSGKPVTMIEKNGKDCHAPIFDSLLSGEARIAILKPFAVPYRFDLAGCGEGLAGDAVTVYKTIYLILVPVDDGTFLGLEINFPEADDTPATLIVRFRPDLTSPFFEQKSDYQRVDYVRIMRYLEQGFRDNPQQAILDLQQAATNAQSQVK